MLRKLLVANWKENPSTREQAESLFIQLKNLKASRSVEIVVCPPFVYLDPMKALKEKAKSVIKMGAQDVFWENSGAFTGEISPLMLKHLSVEYVIVGHSERRRHLAETDEMVRKKVFSVLRNGMKIILCVGEDFSVRRKGFAAAQKFVRSQLEKDLSGIENLRAQTKNLIVAYEPVWAIGTGRADNPQNALAMAKYIKIILNSASPKLSCFFLYGGSVDSKNIGNFLKYKEINGALVGGASLRINEFKKMAGIVGKL